MAFEWMVLALARVPDSDVPCGAIETVNGETYTLARVDPPAEATYAFREQKAGDDATIDFTMFKSPGLVDVIEVSSRGWSVAFEVQGDPRRPDLILKDGNGDGRVDEEIAFKWSGKTLTVPIVEPTLAVAWRWPGAPPLYLDFVGTVEQTTRVVPPTQANVVQRFSYDERGRLTSLADTIGSTELFYTDDNALSGWSVGGVAVGTSKGAPGRPSREKTLFDERYHKSAYTYDSEGRLLTAKLADGVTKMTLTLSYLCPD